MFSQNIRTTGARLAKRAVQKSASASILGKRAYSIVVHTNLPCLRHHWPSVSCIPPCNSFPALRPSRGFRTNSRHGGGQLHLFEDRRSLHTSLCARWSSYLPFAPRLLPRRTLVLQLGNTVYRDLHLAQGTQRHIPSYDLLDVLMPDCSAASKSTSRIRKGFY